MLCFGAKNQSYLDCFPLPLLLLKKNQLLRQIMLECFELLLPYFYTISQIRVQRYEKKMIYARII